MIVVLTNTVPCLYECMRVTVVKYSGSPPGRTTPRDTEGICEGTLAAAGIERMMGAFSGQKPEDFITTAQCGPKLARTDLSLWDTTSVPLAGDSAG